MSTTISGGSVTTPSVVSDSIYTRVEVDDKIGAIPKALSLSASSVLMSGNLAISNTVKTKNHAVVTYTGVSGDATVAVGFEAEFFSDSANSSDYYCVGTEVRLQSDDSVVESGSCLLNTAKYKIKRRDDVGNNCVFDGLRDKTKVIYTNETDAEAAVDGMNHSGTDVVIIGDSGDTNLADATYVMDATLYTHIKWGKTSHNKAYIEAYNPVTREGMIIYEGSGVGGHEISHSMGVEIDYSEVKNLTSAVDWTATRVGGRGNLNLDAHLNYTQLMLYEDDVINISVTDNTTNEDGSTHILCYKCKSETFTIGTYTGTGAANNKIETKDVNGKPVKLRDVVIKRIDDVGGWSEYNSTTEMVGKTTFLNSSDAESDYTLWSFNKGSIKTDKTYDWVNAENGQYLYMGYIDTNAADPDDSYYNKPTDTSKVTIADGVFTYTDGLGATGYNVSSEMVTEEIDCSGISDGVKYVGRKQDGSYVFEDRKPMYSMYEKESAEDNRLVQIDGKWYSTTGGELVSNGTFADGTIDGWSTNSDIDLALSNGMLKIEQHESDYVSAYQIINVDPNTKYIIKSTINRNDNDIAIRVGDSVSGYEYLNGWKYGDGVYVLPFTVGNVSQVHISFQMTTDGNDYKSYIDNISAYKIEPTIGTEQEPISFMEKPIMIANGIPQDIREDAAEMQSMTVKGLVAEKVVADEYVGKNACTAWVNFSEGTPNILNDKFNIKDVVGIDSDNFDVYFETPMDTTNYVANRLITAKSTTKFRVTTTDSQVDLLIFGGKY